MNHAEFVLAVAFDRKTGEDQDSGAVHDLRAPGDDIVGDGIQRKILPRDGFGVVGAAPRLLECPRQRIEMLASALQSCLHRLPKLIILLIRTKQKQNQTVM